MVFSATFVTHSATTGFSYDPISRLETLSHDLDGTGTANDATFGFAYNPASQIVTRSLTNNAYVGFPRLG